RAYPSLRASHRCATARSELRCCQNRGRRADVATAGAVAGAVRGPTAPAASASVRRSFPSRATCAKCPSSTEDAMIKLYGVPRSRAMRCLWMLEELGLPYENVKTDFATGATREPVYLRINPNGHIPALDD